MAYVFTLILALAGFLWASPARDTVLQHGRQGFSVIESMLASGSAPLKAHAQSALAAIRQKAMELIERELHQTVDSIVE
jgi:hypothetical protein